MELIERAAAARVPGAAHEFMAAGPNGEIDALEARPEDPMVIEWKSKALEQLRASATAGDVEALETLANEYESGFLVDTSRELALRYRVAFIEARQLQSGRMPSRGSQEALADLLLQLPPAVADRETRIGKEIAVRCCKR